MQIPVEFIWLFISLSFFHCSVLIVHQFWADKSLHERFKSDQYICKTLTTPAGMCVHVTLKPEADEDDFPVIG